MTYPPFCFVCGAEFDPIGFEWLNDDEAMPCDCGASSNHLETLTLPQRLKIERLIAIDTASKVKVRESFL